MSGGVSKPEGVTGSY